MFERSTEIDDLAGRIFLAEHFCSREIQEAEPNDPVGEVRIWMELNDFDQAPIANSAGTKVVMRSTLLNVDQDLPVTHFAVATPVEHWLDGYEPLQRTLSALAQRDWLLIRSGSELLGVLTRHDLASPVVSAYLLARILGLEQGLRRLYGSFSHIPLPDEPEEPDPSGEAGGWSLATLLNKVESLPSLLKALNHKSRNSFHSATSGMIGLRNHIAHGRSILTLSSRPAEAVERINKLDVLKTKIRQLLEERENLWEVFAATEIIALDNSTLILAGKGAAALPLPPPIHVITAQNPHERVLTDIVNNKRHQLLHNYLKMRFPKAELIEVIGNSCSGPWAETGWAIRGLSRLDALAIAYRFQQRAIFELTKDEVIVIGADAVIRRTIPRLR